MYRDCYQSLLIFMSDWGHVLIQLVFQRLGLNLEVQHYLFLVTRGSIAHLYFVMEQPVVELYYQALVGLYQSSLSRSILLCKDIEMSCVSLNVTCCCIQFQHYKVAVASVYRSPSANYTQCLQDWYRVFTQLLTLSQYVVLAVDLNIDLLRSTRCQREYVDSLADFQMVQLIVEPSRVSTLSSTLINHILCSSSNKVLRVLQTIGISDHHVQMAEFDIPILCHVPETRYVRAFRYCRLG